MNDQADNMSSEEQANIAGQAMDGMGIPTEQANESANLEGGVNEDPHGIKKRLGMQAKKHQKEMRMMQDQLQALQSQVGSRPEEQQPTQSFTGQPQGQPVNDQINQAVAAALRAKDEHDKQMAAQRMEAENNKHMQKQYQEMNDDFDRASEKYEDFDDVVRHPDTPFTPAMRDYALTLPNRVDVLYKLAHKDNRAEMDRISKLRPIEQAREMYKLSVALMGGEKKPEVQAKPMGQIKGNPVASHAVTEKTSVSDIRSRMKSGGWK